MIYNVLGWAASALSLWGFYVNVKKSEWSFFLWGLADLLLIVISIKARLWYLVFLYFAYIVLAVWGYIKWKKEKKDNE